MIRDLGRPVRKLRELRKNRFTSWFRELVLGKGVAPRPAGSEGFRFGITSGSGVTEYRRVGNSRRETRFAEAMAWGACWISYAVLVGW
jgi:hypothetical protein